MTQEQYNRAVAINRQLKELEDVKDEIKDTKEHRLSYTYKKVMEVMNFVMKV